MSKRKRGDIDGPSPLDEEEGVDEEVLREVKRRETADPTTDPVVRLQQAINAVESGNPSGLIGCSL